MDRRTLFKALVGAGGVGALGGRRAEARQTTEYPTYAHPFYADDLRLHWTGWRDSQAHRWLVGQWLAWPEQGTQGDVAYYYLNVPGMQGGRYYPGDSFNLTMRSYEWHYVFPETAEAEKDRLIWAGYECLRDVLREARG